MDEIGQLRIYVAEKHFPVYHELGKTLFSQNSEFFILCTFVGRRLNEQEDIPKKQELCRALTLTDHDWISLRSLYFNKNGSLGTYKQLTQEAERYAFSGLEHLLNNELKDFVAKDEAGKVHLNGNLEELQLRILEYVIQQKEEAPF
ncbi:hypothetical protein [Bacillus sp. EB01]|uniref:hypothetical protein n=1 Tax=Bacillus sp. EB01 TaxID=1347086 RepID=UPI0005C61255|nr:hypothetical protein [Bacillus sp. EB01]